MTSDGAARVLQHYLRSSREALLWKLEGLSERELRLPRTPTGTSLLGLVKHCLNVEAGYFGATFDRRFPDEEELVPLEVYDIDPQADWYATEEETAAGLVDLYRRVASFADAALDELPLDTVGEVPWWPAARRRVTLQEVTVHVLQDLARHAGHADILREQLDGATGLKPGLSNVPDGVDWPAYVTRLTAIADRF